MIITKYGGIVHLGYFQLFSSQEKSTQCTRPSLTNHLGPSIIRLDSIFQKLTQIII